MSPPDAGDRGIHHPATGERAAPLGEALTRLWPHETAQFAAAVQQAQAGEPVLAAVVGEAGRGKTWLLSALTDGARAAGHTSLHVHLDRYFCPRGLAARLSARLVEQNPHLADSLSAPVPALPDDLPAVLLEADVTAREGDRAVVLAFSGLDAHLDAPADQAVVEFFVSLVEAAQAVWRRTLCLVELRSPVERPDAQAIARSGLVYFPVGEPSSEVIASVLSAARPGSVPFAPTVTPVAIMRARGNLHRLVAAMHSISARAAAAGIREVGPVEWEALDTRDFSAEVAAAATTAPAELLAAIADWPAGGCIPLDDLAWRLRAEGVVSEAAEFRELLATLQADAPVLGLAQRGDPAHLAFTWPELRAALAHAVLGGLAETDIALRRRLQAGIATARQDAASGDVEAALGRLGRVLDDAGSEDMDAFGRQSAALAESVWLADGPSQRATRTAAAQLLARAAGARAAGVLARGLASDEAEAQAAAGEALALIGPAAVPAVAHIVGSDDHDARLRAIAMLGRLPCEEALDALLAVLGEPDTDVRLTALASVSALGRERAGPAVMDLAADSDPAVRVAAIRCLAALKYTPALAVVCEALVDESEDARSAATEALAELGDEQAIPALLERLADTRGRVRVSAARALAVFGERARRALLDALKSAEADLRAAAARGFMFFPPRQAVPAVVNCLRDDASGVVEAATEALARFGADAVEPVASLLADREPQVRRSAAHVLALIGAPAVPALQQRLASRMAPTRAAAALALGEMRHEPAVADLAPLARDPEPAVRRAAVQALCMIATPDALGPVVEAMSDADTDVAAQATDSIGGFGEAAIEPLITHLTDPAGETAEAVAAALVRLGAATTPALCRELAAGPHARQRAALAVLQEIRDPAAVDHIASCLALDDLREAAGDALAVFGEAAVPAVIARLGADAVEERAAAVATAARLGAPVLGPALGVLEAGETTARAAAAELLGILADECATPHLVAALADPEPEVRRACAIALGRSGAPGAVEPLAAATRDADPSVQGAAVEALAIFGRPAIEALLADYEAHTGRDLRSPAAIFARMGAGAAMLLSDLLASEIPEFRAGAAGVLALMGHQASVPEIVALLGDPNEMVASRAQAAAEAFGESAAEALTESLLAGDDAVRRAALRVLLRIGPPALPAVVRLLEANAPAIRSIGVWAAAAFGAPAVAAVAEMLDGSGLAEARQAAASCLGRIATRAAADALMRALGDLTPAVRLEAVRALAAIDDSRVLDALLPLIADPEQEVAAAAREAVAGVGEAALPALIARLDDPDAALRDAVADTLAGMPDLATEALIETLGEARDTLRAAAIAGLQRIGAGAAAQPVLDLLAAPTPVGEAARAFAVALPDLCMVGLVERLGVDDGSLRTAARDVCVALGAPAIPALIGVLEAGGERARLEALDALTTIRDQRALDHIIAAHADASPAVRAQVAEALGRFAAPQGLRALCALTADTENLVRRAAVAAMAPLGDAAIAALLDYYGAHEGSVAAELAAALTGLGEGAAETLAGLCRAPEPQRRAGAIRCLIVVRPARLLATLPALLDEDEAPVRAAVLSAAAALGADAVEPLVAPLAGGEDAAVSLASDCLLTIGAPALPAMTALLADADNPHRARAIPVLAGLRLPEAVGPLVDALGDADEGVRLRAQQAVAQFGAEAIPPLLERLDHRDAAVQEAVAGALSGIDEPARPALMEVLATGSGVRQVQALRVLARVGAVEAAPAVAPLLSARPPLADIARDFLLQHVAHAVPALCEQLASADARARDAAARLLIEIGEPAVEGLGHVALNGSVEARLAAAQALGQAPGEQAVIALTLVMRDPEARLRAAAATALASRGALRETVPAVQDEDASVRRAALEALKPHGHSAAGAILEAFAGAWHDMPEHAVAALRFLGRVATDALFEIMRTPAAPARADAIRLLCALNHPAAFGDIAAALGDADEEVRSAARVGLVGAGVAAAPALVQALTKGPDAGREGAAHCLVELGPGVARHLLAAASDTACPDRSAAIRVLAHINPPGVTDHLVAWLGDGVEAVRVAAADGLGRLRPDGALPALFDDIDDDTAPAREARLRAVCAYGQAAVPMLLERASDPALSASPSLARALGTLGELVAETLVAWLDDGNAQRRLAAARALQHVRLEAATPALLARVLDPQPAVREAAAVALAGMGPEAARQLAAHLAAPDETARELYADALALQPDETLEAVAAHLDDPHPATRVAALGVLMRAQREAFLGPVAACVHDREAPVRAAACRALGAHRVTAAVEALLPALEDKDAQVVEAATAGLGALGRVAHEFLAPRLISAEGVLDERVLRALTATGASAGPVLRELLEHEAAGVRAGAATALPTVLGPEAVGDLARLLADPQEAVRAAAVTALAGLGEAAAQAALEVLAAGEPPACLAAADVLGRNGAQLADELMKLLRTDRAGARAGATRALGCLGHQQVAAHLVTRLKDPDASVRFEAVIALGALQWANATPHLLGALEDPDVRVAEAAIGALTRIGEPAIEVLITRLVTAHGQVRDDVVYALAGIGKASVPALLRAMEEGAEATHLAVLRALGIIGGEDAVPPLVDGLADGSPAVQAEAARGVHTLGRLAVPRLVSRLSATPDPEATRRLSAALVELREAALPEVVALLEGRDERLRATAADILASMGTPAAPALRKATGNRDPHVRALALEGIARIGDLSMAPDVIEMLQDNDTDVVSQAIRTLAVLGDERGVTPVVRCVGSHSPAIREAVAFAVTQFGAPTASPLVDLLISDDPRVREQAVNLLQTLGKHAETALLQKLDSDVPRMRIAAIEVMGALGSGAVIDPLVERLGEADLDVRRAVAEALGGIGAPAVGAVLKRLPDPDQSVSDGILMTLTAMSVDPVYSLMEQARHADETVRLAAVRMAGRYGREEAVPTLRQRLQDTSLDINCAAATALGLIGSHGAVQVLAENAVSEREPLAEAIHQGLCDHAAVAVPILVRLAARTEGGPDARFVRVAVEPARAVPGVVDQLLAHDEESVREAAAAVLGEMGSDHSMRTLVRKARDPDAPVRRAAIAALGRMGTEALRPLAGLMDDRDPEARRAAAEVLATLGPRAVDLLVRRLRASRDPAVRVVICHALARADVPAAGDALVETLDGDRDQYVRVAAASALAQLGRTEGLQALQTALGDTDEKMRAEAAEAIAALGGAAALALLPLVDDANARVRGAAAGAFSHVSADQVDLLIQYAAHTDAGVRAAVATALREAPRNAQALQTLVTLLQDDDETVCDAALESLTVFGDVAVEHLGREVLSPDGDARYAACWALGRLGVLAVDALLTALPQASSDAAGDILRALGRIGDQRARGAVLEGMTHENARVRLAAVGAMRRLAGEEDATLLAAGLADDDANVRMVASSVIAGVMTDRLREAVLEMLAHPFSEARAAAARVLGQECHPASLQPLRIATRRETEPWVAEVIEGAIQAVEAG